MLSSQMVSLFKLQISLTLSSDYKCLVFTQIGIQCWVIAVILVYSLPF